MRGDGRFVSRREQRKQVLEIEEMINARSPGAEAPARPPWMDTFDGSYPSLTSKPTLLKGDTGATGPAGAPGAAGSAGATGAAGSNGAVGATGATGSAGATGPAGSGGVLLGTVTISETAITTLLGGPRKVSVAVAGAVIGGNYIAFPVGAVPAGYDIGSAVCTANGTIQFSVYVPVLTLGTYSIPVRVVRINT